MFEAPQLTPFILTRDKVLLTPSPRRGCGGGNIPYPPLCTRMLLFLILFESTFETHGAERG